MAPTDEIRAKDLSGLPGKIPIRNFACVHTPLFVPVEGSRLRPPRLIFAMLQIRLLTGGGVLFSV